MAHFAVGYVALGLLVPVLVWPWCAPLLLIPVMLSALLVRCRTVADREGVTVRTLWASRSVRWEDIEGLRFGRGAWARARLKDGLKDGKDGQDGQDGKEMVLPAVTFATLPLLTGASAGRVPNPYR